MKRRSQPAAPQLTKYERAGASLLVVFRNSSPGSVHESLMRAFSTYCGTAEDDHEAALDKLNAELRRIKAGAT